MKKNEIFEKTVATILGEGTFFDGNIRFDGAIRIDGKITGDLRGAGNVDVGTTGKIKGNINANTVVISGKIIGNIDAKEKIEVLNSSSVIGNLDSKSILIQENATVDGQVKSISNEIKDTLLSEFGKKEKNSK